MPRLSVRAGLVTASLLAGAAGVVGTQALGGDPSPDEAPRVAAPTPAVETPAAATTTSPSSSPVPGPSASPTPPAPEERVEPPVLDPDPPSETPEPSDPEHAGLAARLTAVLAREDLAVDGTVAVSVRDHRGRVVLDTPTATTPLLPASTLKLVTAAAALEALGPDHRFTTRVLAAGEIDAEGTLHGDLLLVGGGDPVLATPDYRAWVYPARPATPLEELATRVRTSGIRRVTGRVVGVDTFFDPPATASGWKDRYFSDFDARRIHGLTVDAALDVEVGVPEPEDGSEPDPDADEELLPLLQSADPRREAAAKLTDLLTERGITVVGAPVATGVVRDGVEVARIASPELSPLLRHTVERSDNHLADTIFRDVGQAILTDADWDAAETAVRRVLRDAGVGAWAGVRMADGSGLSRDDRVTSAFLAELDAAMARSPHAIVWDDLMAVAGVEGTLRGRLRGTIGQGRFLAKTGTLDDVASVAGSVTGPDGARYHLAVVANDVTGAERTRVRLLMDELVLVLAEDLYGCVRVERPASPAPSADAPPSPPPYTLDCTTPWDVDP